MQIVLQEELLDKFIRSIVMLIMMQNGEMKLTQLCQRGLNPQKNLIIQQQKLARYQIILSFLPILLISIMIVILL